MTYKRRLKGSAILIFFIVFVFIVHGNEEEQQGMVGNGKVTSFLAKVKNLIGQVQGFIFPPNIDFRGGGGDERKGNGDGKRLKEAVTKTVEKTKAAIDESAKSAADMAAETVHKAKEKVKRSLSDSDEKKSEVHAEL